MSDTSPQVGLVVVNTGIGGVERRFARLHAWARDHAPGRYQLFVAAPLRVALERQGLVAPDDSSVVSLFASGMAQGFGLVPHARRARIRGLERLLLPRAVASLRRGAVGDALSRCDVLHFALPSPWVAPASWPSHRVLVEVVDSTYENLADPQFVELVRAGRAHFNCLSGPIRDAFVARHLALDPTLPARCHVSPASFVDYRGIAPAPKERVLVFAGRLVDEKQPLRFVEAAARVLAADPTVRASVLGDGPLAPVVDHAIATSGVADRFTRAFSQHPTAVLARAAVFVSLQRHDNYPSQAVLEAMACGCRIVATAVGDTARLVRPPWGRLVAADADASTLAAAMAAALAPASLTEDGAAGRDFAMTEHSPARFLAHVEALYRAMS